MLRFAAISGRSVGSEKLWMGETHVWPHMARPTITMGNLKRRSCPQRSPRVRLPRRRTRSPGSNPGDYIFVLPYVPHREENPNPDEPAVIVVARTAQEAIVVNLPALYAL